MAAGRVTAASVCTLCVCGLLAAAGNAATTRAQRHSTPTLGPTGIGAVRFGEPKQKAVVDLSRSFGAPNGRGINTGCGSRFSEVVWGDLAVEFRSGVFSGYRYLVGGYPLTTRGSPRARAPKAVSPRLATANGITLGSTLAKTRAAYGSLRRIAADGWRAQDAIVFVDNAKRDPVPPTSQIVEIKIGTCGDF